MNIAGVYEYEIRRYVSLEDIVKRIIHHQPQLTLHFFNPPTRDLGKVLPELSQPDGYLRRLTYG